MRVGFVHGVMNTDNMSVLGLTIDYGPYGWVDNFDPSWTPNTTDAAGKRYCFGRQPGVAKWNLARLGDAIARLGIDAELIERELAKYASRYSRDIKQTYSDKFGLDDWSDAYGDLIADAFALMEKSQIDMTIFFRTLAKAESVDDLKVSFYLDGQWSLARNDFVAWFTRYKSATRGQSREARIDRMNKSNPKYVFRNYLAQEAIDLAHQGDYTQITRLLTVLRNPYDEQPENERFAAKRPEWALNKAGCSMLSCSS
jgi:serine/tyrosine/threonine adenylyltransferase